MKKSIKIFCLIVGAHGLTGCEGVALLTDPSKTTMNIEGRTISVVYRDGKWVSFPDGWQTLNGVNYINLRRQQIQAIEKKTGCRVTANEYIYGTLALQTEIDCTPRQNKTFSTEP